MTDTEIDFNTCQDIRNFFDDFAHKEISKENPNRQLAPTHINQDGKLRDPEYRRVSRFRDYGALPSQGAPAKHARGPASTSGLALGFAILCREGQAGNDRCFSHQRKRSVRSRACAGSGDRQRRWNGRSRPAPAAPGCFNRSSRCAGPPMG